MHPFFSRPGPLLLYLASWLGLSLLASFAVSYPDGSFLTSARTIVPSALLFSFVSLSSWSLCRAYPLQDTHPVILGISILSTSLLVGGLLSGFLIGFMFLFGDLPRSGEFDDMWQFRGTPVLIYLTGVVLYLLSVMFHYLLIAYEASRDAERRSLNAEIHARSSELKALRMQIDPHFLFNALNSITALIASDPERARTMTVQLAGFFRASVAAGRQHLVTLREETELLRMYLEIEQVRFGKRLQVNLENPEMLDRLKVPPLILQPLVENAIKHGISHLLDGGTISIVARATGDNLSVTIRNPVDPERRGALTNGTGFGLQVVRDRLKALAPGQGFLDTRHHDGSFEATITLPTDLT